MQRPCAGMNATVIVAVKADNNHWLHSEEWIRRMKTIDPFQHVQHVRNVNCWVVYSEWMQSQPHPRCRTSNIRTQYEAVPALPVTKWLPSRVPPLRQWHATQRFFHCTFCKGLARCRLAWLSLSLFLRSSPKLTVTETSIHQASSGLLMADWCLLGADGQIVICDTHILQSTHTHKHTWHQLPSHTSSI